MKSHDIVTDLDTCHSTDFQKGSRFSKLHLNITHYEPTCDDLNNASAIGSCIRLLRPQLIHCLVRVRMYDLVRGGVPLRVDFEVLKSHAKPSLPPSLLLPRPLPCLLRLPEDQNVKLLGAASVPCLTLYHHSPHHDDHGLNLGNYKQCPTHIKCSSL